MTTRPQGETRMKAECSPPGGCCVPEIRPSVWVAPQPGGRRSPRMLARVIDLAGRVVPIAALRSLLFVPADAPERLAAAFASEADAVVAGLELDAIVLPKATPEAVAALGPDALELLYARSKVVADSAAAGVRPPFDRVFPGRGDPEGLEADCRFARSTGFGGKGCTHVGQPAVVNRVFGERPGGASRAALFEP
jgi:hypothetical protein